MTQPAILKTSHCLQLEVTENRDHWLINVGIEQGAWLIANLRGIRQHVCYRVCLPQVTPEKSCINITYRTQLPSSLFRVGNSAFIAGTCIDLSFNATLPHCLGVRKKHLSNNINSSVTRSKMTDVATMVMEERETPISRDWLPSLLRGRNMWRALKLFTRYKWCHLPRFSCTAWSA
jgi:hypothetical protein